jgi:hypothetical protein
MRQFDNMLPISQLRRDRVFFMKPSEIRKAMKDLWQEMQTTMERGSEEWKIANADLNYMQDQLPNPLD